MTNHVKDLALPILDRIWKFRADYPFVSGIIVGAIGSFLFSFFVH